MDVFQRPLPRLGRRKRKSSPSKQSKAPPSPRASLRRGAWNYNGQLRISTIYIYIIIIIYHIYIYIIYMIHIYI